MLYRSSKEVMSHGQFNLRKFVTNTPSLQSSINAQENELSNTSPPGIESAGAETIYPSSQQKVLGVSWDLVDDQLIFSLESFVTHHSTLSYCVVLTHLLLPAALDQDQQTLDQPLSEMAYREVWSCCHMCEWTTTSDSGRV